ncbi:MAE_28990/MAE_18760 family HEPN-like nuclease [Devosia sp. A449]
MRAVIDLLRDRRSEFDSHRHVVSFLEARVGQSGGEITGSIDRRHVAISKAGLLVHLYNIVEAVMGGALKEVMTAVADHEPVHYEARLFAEWARQSAGTHVLMSEDTRFSRTLELSLVLAERKKSPPVPPPKMSGNWDDEKIAAVAERLGCRLQVAVDVRKAARSPFFNDKSRMYYVMKRRNDLAHGNMTFEDGGREKTLGEINEIADATLNYIDAVVLSFERYVTQKEFLRSDKK